MRLTGGRQRALDEIADRQGPEYAAAFIDDYAGPRDDLLGDLMAAESKLRDERLARADADERAWQQVKAADAAAMPRSSNGGPASLADAMHAALAPRIGDVPEEPDAPRSAAPRRSAGKAVTDDGSRHSSGSRAVGAEGSDSPSALRVRGARSVDRPATEGR
jgi:hypothetical protein